MLKVDGHDTLLPTNTRSRNGAYDAMVMSEITVARVKKEYFTEHSNHKAARFAVIMSKALRHGPPTRKQLV